MGETTVRFCFGMTSRVFTCMTSRVCQQEDKAFKLSGLGKVSIEKYFRTANFKALCDTTKASFFVALAVEGMFPPYQRLFY